MKPPAELWGQVVTRDSTRGLFCPSNDTMHHGDRDANGLYLKYCPLYCNRAIPIGFVLLLLIFYRRLNESKFK